MSRTALIDGLRALDLEAVRQALDRTPALAGLALPNGFNLLQACCARRTAGDPAAARRQLRLARWLVERGFDPKVTCTTKPGEDGEEEVSTLSLAFLAIARAQNTALARWCLEQGAAPGAMFAAAWWGNWEILKDLVRHGDDVNVVVGGGTPLLMAIDVLERGTAGRPSLAGRRRKLVEELLRLGADPNLAGTGGITPLHHLMAKGYDPAVITLLLRHSADPDRPGPDGRSAREVARRKRDTRYTRAIKARSGQIGGGRA